MSLYDRGKARRSLIDTMAYRALSQVATFTSYVVLVRAMSEQDFGVFNLLYAFIPVISTVVSLGLEQTLRRFQPEYLRAGNQPAAAWLTRFVGSARFVVDVIVLAGMFAAWNVIAPLFQLEPYRFPFALFCLLFILHFQARVLQLSLGSHMLHRYSVGSMAVMPIVKLIAYGGIVLFGTMTLEHAILADTIAYAIAYAVLRVAYNKHCGTPEAKQHFRPDATERKRLVRYGLFNNFNDAGSMLLSTRSDNFYIAALIDPISVGIYSFYNRLNEMINNVSPVRLFENVVQPLFFSMSAQQAEKRVPEVFTLLLNANLLLQWPVLAFATAYHREIVAIVFAGKFIDYSWMLPLVVTFGMLNIFTVPATLVAQYEEKSGIILLSKLSAIYNIIALLTLIPLFGLYGATFASGSAQLLKNGFIWWHVRDRAVWLNGRAAVFTGLSLWGAVVGICYGVKEITHWPPIVHLVIGVILCGIATLIHLRSPALAISDRQILASVMGGREATVLRRLGIFLPADAR
jgi:O-antigen/teichoic acid export membrane protein